MLFAALILLSRGEFAASSASAAINMTLESVGPNLVGTFIIIFVGGGLMAGAQLTGIMLQL
ncbi:MAG TPA: hypothetical protein DEA90_16350 [Opitutae bacterium]|nr:hypothetical protein [Puniceicoccaceae bacterium]HBR95729.1 hypothetical protein [Opitutae bacterium]